MGFSCGIVGLPNVGKSALFNALTASQQAASGNYAFTTVEPNVGRVAVPDERLDTIAKLAKSKTVTPTRLDFVDIAGLAAGASRGEGLGNRFLAHIREVEAIAHVLRCFDDPNVPHPAGKIDPVADAETVETELLLADLESMERRIEPLAKRARGDDKEAKALLPLAEKVRAALAEGKPARAVVLADGERPLFRNLQLLTAKPILYVCNVDEGAAATGNDHSRRVAEMAKEKGAAMVIISAAIEAEVAQLADPAERAEFLGSLGLKETGLARVIQAGYALLDLITFFTEGPKESRAWTIPRGTKAPQAGRTIHSDFERGFIAAETIAYADFVAFGGEQGAKAAGKARLEGRDYVVADGDVILFRFNV
jgi:GTP-binding protein YchF